MPCHGDRGQGLTDEFRSLWVSDHQNYRARGCHTGRADDQGFPIPRIVPAIISTTGKLSSFSAPERLFQFLRTTHPPRHPGYLLEQNGCLTPGQVLSPQGTPGQ